MTETLSITNLASVSALVALAVFGSRALSLKLEHAIVIASLRAAVQLFFLGYVLLVPIFRSRSPALVVTYLGAVLLVAAREAGASAAYTYGNALYLHALAAIGSSATLIMTYLIAFVLSPNPWWQPQYVVPIAGMVVGNSIAALSLSLNRFLSGLKTRSGEVELRLALGSSRGEAVLPLAREACVAGMTPNLNQMTVTGLVAIPGMMTGQILGGQSPGDAARYQLMILLVICATGFVTVVVGLGLAISTLLDDQHRLALSGASTSSTSSLDGVSNNKRSLLARCCRLGTQFGLRKNLEPRNDIVIFASSALVKCWDRLNCSGNLISFGRVRGYEAISDEHDAHTPAVIVRHDVGQGVPSGQQHPARHTIELVRFPRAVSTDGAGAAEEAMDPKAAGKTTGDVSCGGRWALEIANLAVSVPVHDESRDVDSSSTSVQPAADEYPVLPIKMLIDGFSFTVSPGNVLCVVGRSGCGKSRLLRVLAGLDPLPGAAAGAVRLEPIDPIPEPIVAQNQYTSTHKRHGIALTTRQTFGAKLGLWCDFMPSAAVGVEVGEMAKTESLPAWRTRVCYFPQDVPSLLGTPTDLLLEANTFASRCQGDSKNVGPLSAGQQQRLVEETLASRAEELGLDATCLRRPWSALSGGEKQRACLSVVLSLTLPAVLLLDEPTSACDHYTALKVEACLLRRARQGLGLVWVSHDPEQVQRVATHVLNLTN